MVLCVDLWIGIAPPPQVTGLIPSVMKSHDSVFYSLKLLILCFKELIIFGDNRLPYFPTNFSNKYKYIFMFMPYKDLPFIDVISRHN